MLCHGKICAVFFSTSNPIKCENASPPGDTGGEAMKDLLPLLVRSYLAAVAFGALEGFACFGFFVSFLGDLSPMVRSFLPVREPLTASSRAASARCQMIFYPFSRNIARSNREIIFTTPMPSENGRVLGREPCIMQNVDYQLRVTGDKLLHTTP